MKKKIAVLLSLIVLLIVSVYTFAEPLKVLSAFASFPNTKIAHTAIATVSAIDRLLNAKISVDFTGYQSATAKIIYYMNGNPSSKQEEPVEEGKKINNKEDFYISLPQFSDTDTSVSYQIKIALKDANGNTSYSYWPSGTSGDTFETSQITSVASTVIGTSSGTVILDSGNQEIGNTMLIVSKNTFATDNKIIIEEFDPNDDIFLAAGKTKANVYCFV